MIKELKHDILHWIDNNGASVSEDFITLTGLWTIAVYSSNYFNIITVYAADFFKVTTFLVLFAYILLAAKKNEQNSDILSYGEGR